jgi:hypothetical protein
MLKEAEDAVAPKLPSFFPSFVECAPPRTGEEPPEVVNYWNPKPTGIAALDVQRAAVYFSEALAFAREIRAPYFLVSVLKEMRGGSLGTIEQAFLHQLTSKATAGGRSQEMGAEDALSWAALYGTDLETIRGVEAAVQDFILMANQRRRPDALFCLLADWMRAPEGWVSEVAAIAICVAAMKGALH